MNTSQTRAISKGMASIFPSMFVMPDFHTSPGSETYVRLDMSVAMMLRPIANQGMLRLARKYSSLVSCRREKYAPRQSIAAR